jgi:sugar lactone lactonase YvrE
MHDHVVCRIDADGRKTVVAEVPQQPSGLGWLPDGRLLIVSMRDRSILVQNAHGLELWCDLSPLAKHDCNDMVVDALGRCWVGNFGFDLHAGDAMTTTELILVRGQHQAEVAASDLFFPNGSVITPDGRTLIVAETFAACLTAFDIEPDGQLSNRRVWAQLDGAVPDGICLDMAGGIWVASPTSQECLRVIAGGEVTDRIKVEDEAFACMLGGDNGRQLFILTAPSSVPKDCQQARAGKIVCTEVEHARAGCP